MPAALDVSNIRFRCAVIGADRQLTALRPKLSGEPMRRIYVAVAATLLAAEARGQIATTTSLVGTITDTSDKPIAGCHISAVNQGSGDTYSVLTSERGNYNI